MTNAEIENDTINDIVHCFSNFLFFAFHWKRIEGKYGDRIYSLCGGLSTACFELKFFLCSRKAILTRHVWVKRGSHKNCIYLRVICRKKFYSKAKTKEKTFAEMKRINYVIKWHSETTKTLTIHRSTTNWLTYVSKYTRASS